METNQLHGAEQPETNSQTPRPTSTSLPMVTVAWLAAYLLILVGVAFQLGMLGYGPYNSSGVLLFSVIGRNAWIVLADLVVPELRELVTIWPLMLVGLGSGILMIARRRDRLESRAASSGKKEKHAN